MGTSISSLEEAMVEAMVGRFIPSNFGSHLLEIADYISPPESNRASEARSRDSITEYLVGFRQ